MELKGTQTEQNLKTALTGESIARNKYTFFADKAKQEGHPDVAELFEKMAKNESTHAKLLYTSLYGSIQDSMANLKIAASGENDEWMTMYPDFAKIAREEGFPELAALFEKIADIEKDQEKRFLKAMMNLAAEGKAKSTEDTPKPQPTKTVAGYRCMFCGATYEKRPDVCSVCGAIGSFEDCDIIK